MKLKEKKEQREERINTTGQYQFLNINGEQQTAI